MWSMTGFGKSNGVFEGKKFSIEIRSLNSKGLDVSLKLPNAFRSFEPEIRTRIAETLERGKIELGIYQEDHEMQANDTIDWRLAQGYLDQLKRFSEDNNLPIKDWTNALMHMPGVIKTNSTETSEKEKAFVFSLLEETLLAAQNFRLSEGSHLRKDLEEVLGAIENLLSQLDPYEKERYATMRQRLELAIQTLPAEQLDGVRLEQEVLFYLDKLDVSEEKIRLRSHLAYFNETVNASASCGKKLGFIVQEMGREINTLGSKSNHAMMQRTVVEMKNHLEKLKEQVQNVL